MVNGSAGSMKSMTGFASLTGQGHGYSWAWELRSVNARGLDLRLRLPDWIDGLEAAVRAAFKGRVARGNLNLTLRVSKDSDTASLAVNQKVLSEVLSLLRQAETAAREGAGISLSPSTAIDVLNQRGVIEQANAQDDTGPLCEAIVAQIDDLLESFNQMRALEGTSLLKILNDQVDLIERLTNDSAPVAEARKGNWSNVIRENLEKALDSIGSADEERVAQELALIVVKSDVTEEIDRLRAHIATARELLIAEGPVGRKLDFLTQEFNREANTLCSKSQSKELTRIGLDLKVVIDQMREQVQNVE